MTAIFIPSGIDRPAHFSLLVAEQLTGMINAHNALQPNLYRAYTTQWKSVPLVLDCGSFQSGQRDVVEYTALIEHIGARFLWISNLDALWRPQIGEKNFAYLQTHLPADVAKKILWIYQPGGSLADVEWFAKTRRTIGIGGLIPLMKQQGIDAVLRLLHVLGERLNQVGGKAHLFGVSSPQILLHLRGEAWFASTDSSKWLVAYKAAQVLRMSGTGQCRASQLGLCLLPEEMAANNLRVLQWWVGTNSPMQLALFEDEENDDVYDHKPICQDENEFQFIVLLCSLSVEEALELFLKRFPDMASSWDGSDEDGEIFVTVIARASLENDLVAWCASVKDIGYLTDYDVWREEEAMAV